VVQVTALHAAAVTLARANLPAFGRDADSIADAAFARCSPVPRPPCNSG
jgi:hypothetical protein